MLNILRAVKDTDTATKPAYEALLAHRRKVDTIQAQDLAWAEKEGAEHPHGRAFIVAAAELTQLEQRRIDATADLEVEGHTDADLVALGREIVAKREELSVLQERAELATAKLSRIAAKRSELRQQIEALNKDTLPLVVAARNERLADAMSTLLQAESAYVRALEEAFGVAASVNEAIQADPLGVRHELAGGLDLSERLLQRPHHTKFSETPWPTRAEIVAAIQSTAAQVAKEI